MLDLIRALLPRHVHREEKGWERGRPQEAIAVGQQRGTTARRWSTCSHASKQRRLLCSCKPSSIGVVCGGLLLVKQARVGGLTARVGRLDYLDKRAVDKHPFCSAMPT